MKRIDDTLRGNKQAPLRVYSNANEKDLLAVWLSGGKGYDIIKDEKHVDEFLNIVAENIVEYKITQQ